MQYRVDPPGAEFQRAVEKLRTGPKKTRLAMNKAIKAATAPAEAELKREIMAIQSKGVRGGGGKQRSAHLQSRSRSNRLSKHTGLRRNIAKGIRRKISYSARGAGVEIKAASTYLPTDQRTLIGKTNSGKNFRHPVMGDRRVWVDQSFSPAGWFDRTVKKYGPETIRKIDEAARRSMDDWQ